MAFLIQHVAHSRAFFHEPEKLRGHAGTLAAARRYSLFSNFVQRYTVLILA
jgi:hypothetical protein